MNKHSDGGLNRVLYIGGWGRSGSTLLDLMIGQVPGFFSAGEVRELWRSGCVENRPCGCGVPFSSCAFWQQVGDEAFGGWESLDLEEVLRLRYRFDRQWAVPLLATSSGWGASDRAIQRYLAILVRLYSAVRTVSGAQVIVDSSNLPSHALLLRKLGLDLRLLHLVRDSRGVAYSWAKQVPKATAGPVEFLPRYNPLSSSLRWSLYNGATNAMRYMGVPYLRQRYEDLIADPVTSLATIVRFAGGETTPAALAHVHIGDVEMRTNHTVEGNPMRSTVGKVELRADEQWREAMNPVTRLFVTGMTMPMLAAYRYPLRVRHTSHPTTDHSIPASP